jgi:threonine dehydratase
MNLSAFFTGTYKTKFSSYFFPDRIMPNGSIMSVVHWEDIVEAKERIAPFVHQTPVLTCRAVNNASGHTVFFKCENFQRTGSFKFRGACNAVASLTEKERHRGVVTHSSGNHAQALALAARLHDASAYVIIPEGGSHVKRAAAESYGATVIPCEPTYTSREETAKRVREETGACFVNSHDDKRIIAGQGTAAVELIETVGPLDSILTPVGGGGLLAGTAIAVSHLLPEAKVVGCEPAGADDAYRSFQRRQRVKEVKANTIADGLRTPLGVLNFEIIIEQVNDIVRVSEEEIVKAMRFIWERMKLIIEPSSAVAVAPLLARSLGVRQKRIGVILSGGNVDLGHFFRRL